MRRQATLSLAAIALAASFLATTIILATPPGAGQSSAGAIAKRKASSTMSNAETSSTAPIAKSDDEWRKELTPEQYRVLRQHGTERAFTGAYWNDHEKGLYYCAGCGSELFKSDAKFDSGTGWPSFYEPAAASAVATSVDTSLGSTRTEVHCAKCGGHLGHVFNDGPNPTGLRYCINSVSLKKDK